MQHFFPRILPVLFSLALLAACSSKKEDDPTPPPVTAAVTGTISGQINPANSITTVTAVDSVNKATTATPTATGAYTLSVPAGRYTLRFTPAANYTAPADQLVRVYAKGTTHPDPTNVTASGGTATLSVNGTAVAVSLVRAQLAFGDLTLTLLTATGQSVTLLVSPYTSNTTRTGSFAGFSNAQLRYSDGNASWSAPTTGNPVGSYTITPVSTSPLRISGDFNAPLSVVSGGATGTKTISGTFANVAY